MNRSNNKRINIGIQILRMISCFGVITTHCYNLNWNKRLQYYLYVNPLHVPNFMFISFYFYYNPLLTRIIRKIIQRFERLLIPYLIWSFLFGLINNICLYLFGFCKYGRYISIKDYLYQIIIGERYFFVFWYSTVLLFLSLIFTIIGFSFKEHFLFTIQLFGFILYALHRSSIYIFLVKNNLMNISFILTFRFAPISVFGLTLGSFDIIANMKQFYIKNIIINVISLYYLVKFRIFKFNEEYIYPDVDTNIISSINFFIIFALIPFDKILNEKIIVIIAHITNYTGGIYYLHLFMRFYLKNIFEEVRRKTFIGIFIIYFITYLVCYIGNKVFKKSKIKYLFI